MAEFWFFESQSRLPFSWRGPIRATVVNIPVHGKTDGTSIVTVMITTPFWLVELGQKPTYSSVVQILADKVEEKEKSRGEHHLFVLDNVPRRLGPESHSDRDLFGNGTKVNCTLTPALPR